ncbi:MAG TPA: site-specific integrase [Methanocorpusculum sp.]|nr:tyrosine-type recombinase/integrase [Candidatus Methanocorpusculum equi]HJJ33735.1 site-specific integrase [Methanocorpusculum sp.]
MRNQFYYKEETDSRYLKQSENCINKAVEDGRITSSEAAIIRLYLSEKDSQGIVASRHYKLANQVIYLKDVVQKPFDICSTQDILTGFVQIKTLTKHLRHNETTDKAVKLTQNSINDKQRILKSFSVWLAESGLNPHLDITKLNKMKPETPTQTAVKVEDLLTGEELEAFFKECRTTRDKALFHVMFEGGLRCCDVGNLRFRDILITDKISRIKTNGKTGKMRSIPLIESRDILVEYMCSRGNYSEDDFVFLNQYNKPISQATISSQMKKIAKRAGITKNVHPHLLRHARITELTKLGMKESFIKQLAWGNQNTNMMRVYSHLSEDDLKNELLRVNDIELPEVGTAKALESKHRPVQCQHCGTILPRGSKYCDKCHMPILENPQEELMKAVSLIYSTLQQNPGALSAWALQQQK